MAQTKPVVAILYQALAPPMYGGVSKPPKPGGYRDSGSDVAYTLARSGTTVLTPVESPDPANQEHWCFPDTEEGILMAVQKGATHLWANTVLFAKHPIQTSSLLTPYESQIKVIGQPPLCADQFDDKSFVNDCLRRHGGLTLPKSWTLDDPQAKGIEETSLDEENTKRLLESIHEQDYPIVAKPVRGRGSHGVKICRNATELAEHVTQLFSESPRVLLEEYLAGEEGTITIMPPSFQVDHVSDSSERFARHWALPPVTRFNHVNGIAPYSGNVAVTVNSRAVTDAEIEADPAYATIMKECETVASLLQTTAPLRIDVRRFGSKSKFALFDINMKPNITGPGRPGRDDQTSLMGLAAKGMGWDYPRFLQYVLGSAKQLGQLRDYRSVLSKESFT
ncbi:glutathione synthetase ATP-binding domain-like protein [Penicillium macrosclerotiorum]|uniref:glutathione synthetase ATP-binding domain-like protein n=1 Tax=Penicillium macrosclerotiorum TaxID=303699 RepID=UPI0025486DBB|nr:glutathione synthetase ATP-binding domain-like protein [Penicillium macrosclerotiorum]KAJ5679261.1 glutathione synthetase ATP-binding domain-like protein [Penicillium macrosclerotiorum]